MWLHKKRIPVGYPGHRPSLYADGFFIASKHVWAHVIIKISKIMYSLEVQLYFILLYYTGA